MSFQAVNRPKETIYNVQLKTTAYSQVHLSGFCFPITTVQCIEHKFTVSSICETICSIQTDKLEPSTWEIPIFGIYFAQVSAA
jgi:hypothetical protein